MTPSRRRQLRIVIATVGLFFASALVADRVLAQGAYWSCSAPSPRCIPLTLTANLQLTNLHAAVSHADISCTATLPRVTMTQPSARVAVVNRSFTGSVTTTILLPAEALSGPADRTGTAACELRLVNGTTTRAAVASAAQPVGALEWNWEVVSTGSTVKWTQAVTFPNANATP
jgi:hypothetical protein